MRVQGTVDKGAFGIMTPYLAWSTHVCTMYGRDPGAKWMANIQSSLQYVLRSTRPRRWLGEYEWDLTGDQ